MYVCIIINWASRTLQEHFYSFNPRTYTQIHTPTVLQREGGGVDETPPQSGDIIQVMYLYFLLLATKL